ncbi:MAG TPA: M50 family metallopeptidase [Candidatus Saccharimonadales bacterium]|nr:M50 family metallopeptidase [Candidatus Saccharimonadales bacterium]
MGLVIGIIVGLLILVFLVSVHELGHAIVARRNGVVVEEFGVGFPPRAWGRKLKNGTYFTLNWLPLGGFVKLQGENDAADKKGDFGSTTVWQKTKILFAGVVSNWLVAVVLLTILALVGLPKVLPNQISIPNDTQIITKPVEISSITANYPADKAGLKTGDSIIKFAGQDVPTVDGLINNIKNHAGKDVAVVYSRNNSEQSVNLKLKDNTSGEIFGAGLGQRESIKATWSAPIVGVLTTAQFTWVTVQGVGDLVGGLVHGLVLQFSPVSSVRGQASSELKTVGDSVAGPIGIIGVIFPAAERAGLVQLVFLTAIISLTLAVMNILPIPALDGGRWALLVIFKLKKRKLTKELEEKIQTIGFTILMGLVILVTIADVAKLF